MKMKHLLLSSMGRVFTSSFRKTITLNPGHILSRCEVFWELDLELEESEQGQEGGIGGNASSLQGSRCLGPRDLFVSPGQDKIPSKPAFLRPA